MSGWLFFTRGPKFGSESDPSDLSKLCSLLLISLSGTGYFANTFNSNFCTPSPGDSESPGEFVPQFAGSIYFLTFHKLTTLILSL